MDDDEGVQLLRVSSVCLLKSYVLLLILASQDLF